MNVISFLFPLIGLIYYLVKKDTEPEKAKDCGKWALIGVGVGFACWILMFVIGIVMAGMSGMYY